MEKDMEHGMKNELIKGAPGIVGLRAYLAIVV